MYFGSVRYFIVTCILQILKTVNKVVMIMIENKLMLFLLTISFFFIGQDAYCAQRSSQVLSTSLPQVMEIEKVVVETAEYKRDEPMPNMKIKHSQSTSPNDIILRLSPVKVQIRTNSSTPIVVNAKFKELKHKNNEFDFNPSNLSIQPASITINDPYDHVITDVFTPFVNVKSDTVVGHYRGSILFTLGAI